jgi:hypothetical protein
MEFKVTKDGVEIGGALVKYAQTPDEFKTYAGKLELENRVHVTLNEAIANFLGGRGDYQDAYVRLKELHLQFGIADNAYRALLRDIDAYMESPITIHFNGSTVDLEGCVREIVDTRLTETKE